jgi:hypothetical protein
LHLTTWGWLIKPTLNTKMNFIFCN